MEFEGPRDWVEFEDYIESHRGEAVVKSLVIFMFRDYPQRRSRPSWGERLFRGRRCRSWRSSSVRWIDCLWQQEYKFIDEDENYGGSPPGAHGDGVSLSVVGPNRRPAPHVPRAGVLQPGYFP